MVVAGQPLKKQDAYVSLAASVNSVCGSNWSSKNAKSRYEAYLKTYKETAQDSNRTGFGVTEEDNTNDIFTIMDKLESLCPFFYKMDNLFGSRQNVVPSNVQESENLRASDVEDGEDGEEYTTDKENDSDILKKKPKAPKTPQNATLPQMSSSGTSKSKRQVKAI